MVSNIGCWWGIRWEGVCPLQKITSFFKLFCFLNFWLCWAVCGILVPHRGMEPRPLASREWSAKHWTTRDFPANHFFVKEAQNAFFPSPSLSSEDPFSTVKNWTLRPCFCPCKRVILQRVNVGVAVCREPTSEKNEWKHKTYGSPGRASRKCDSW